MTADTPNGDLPARAPKPDTALPDEAGILDYVKNSIAPLDIRHLAKAFNIPKAHRRTFRQMLRDMDARGLFDDHKAQDDAIKAPAEICVLELTAFDDQGDGVARLLDTHPSPPEIRVLLSRQAGRAPAIGQHILARLRHSGSNQYEARIIRVLDRQAKRIFGIAVAAGKGFRLQPAERGKRDNIMLRLGATDELAAGDLVEAELLASRGTINKTARILNNLGSSKKAGAFSALAIAEFGIRHHFPDNALAETKNMKVPPVRGRQDLRDIALVTIDGADARDFDDAVFAEPTIDGGWRILVAIADVAHYVRPGSTLDLEARKRGNSVYFPDRVVPMLPEAISNDLCSLRPQEDRAAMVAELSIDSTGTVKTHQIYRALIRSRARLTYDQVQAVYDGALDETDCAVPHGTLHALFGAWHALDTARQAREPLALNLSERRVVMGEAGLPVAIGQRRQTASQRLIEDFMIAANVVAAETLLAKTRPCVFRIHDTPDPKKAAGLSKLAESLGGSFAKGQVLRPHHFNHILALADGTDDEITVNETVLRSQAKAIYSIDNIGHFGLALRHYAHFTSPIRRYADLLVHRSLVDQITIGKANAKDGLQGMSIVELAEICTCISETESTAAAAERRTIDRFAAMLFQSRVGAVVAGTISSVTSFGLFIRLEDGAADGLLPIRALPDDFYNFDEENQSLDGRHHGWSFRAGTNVEVKITEVTPVSGGIMLDWVSGGIQNDQPKDRRHKAKSHRRQRSNKSRGKSGRPMRGRR